MPKKILIFCLLIYPSMACETPETVYAAQVVANPDGTFTVLRWIAEGAFGNVVVRRRGPYRSEALAAKTARLLVDCSMSSLDDSIAFDKIFVNRDSFKGVYFGTGNLIGCIALLFAEKKEIADEKNGALEAVVHLRVGADFSAEVRHLLPLVPYRIDASADDLSVIIGGCVPIDGETLSISNAIYEAFVTAEKNA